jgi:PPM family protein phosphatase
MSDFEKHIEYWLSRITATSKVNVCFDLPVVLATDIGITRQENQDRLAAIRIGTNDPQKKPLIAIVASDGMGGMLDGAKTASLTVAGFLSGLIQKKFSDTETLIRSAVKETNTKIYSIYNGSGGATLSALVIDQSRTWLVNIGDSRIYAINSDKKVERLTVDDSLKEAVGGHGRELLQFMGMGDGIMPHVNEFNKNPKLIALTTDGAHEIEQSVLECLLSNAPSLEHTARRVIAVSSWCGVKDNASIAMLDFESLSSGKDGISQGGIQIWDPHGTLSLIRTHDDHEDHDRYEADHEIATTEPPEEPIHHSEQSADDQIFKSSKSSKKTNKRKQLKNIAQLEIEIESPPNPSDDTK